MSGIRAMLEWMSPRRSASSRAIHWPWSEIFLLPPRCVAPHGNSSSLIKVIRKVREWTANLIGRSRRKCKTAKAALSGKITEENAITGFSPPEGGTEQAIKCVNRWMYIIGSRGGGGNVGQGWVQGATTILARLCLSFTMINFFILFFFASTKTPRALSTGSSALTLALAGKFISKINKINVFYG